VNPPPPRLWQQILPPSRHRYLIDTIKPPQSPPLTIFVRHSHDRNIRPRLHFYSDMYIPPATPGPSRYCLFTSQLTSPSSIPVTPRTGFVAHFRDHLLPLYISTAQSISPESCQASLTVSSKRSLKLVLALAGQYSRPGLLPEKMVPRCASGGD
jgi:hypothetical protein